MTPAARIAAAIGILDDIAAGTAAEKALTGWARGNRYAGSGDRAAVRDHVFGALRCWRSFAARGGAETGRARMIGALRAEGLDPDAIFTGTGHAPAPLDPAERAAERAPEPGSEACDMPDWLWQRMTERLGPEDATAAARQLQARAPTSLRVNTARSSLAEAADLLRADGIDTEPNPVAATALTVTSGARRIRMSAAFTQGLVELQDAASQALVAELPVLGSGDRFLDYCAGGGGKALAYATRSTAAITAHDVDPGRMSDLSARAGRAGATIHIQPDPAALGPHELVLCDVPCSGSGAWRRSPEAKWRLTPERLDDLRATQDLILRDAAGLVAPGGTLAYATCSLLPDENLDRVDAFCARSGWACRRQMSWPVTQGSDGFFLALLTRDRRSGDTTTR